MAHKTIALTTELKELDWLESAIIDKLDQVIQKTRPLKGEAANAEDGKLRVWICKHRGLRIQTQQLLTQASYHAQPQKKKKHMTSMQAARVDAKDLVCPSAPKPPLHSHQKHMTSTQASRVDAKDVVCPSAPKPHAALAAQQPPPPGEATHKAALHAFIWR